MGGQNDRQYQSVVSIDSIGIDPSIRSRLCPAMHLGSGSVLPSWRLQGRYLKGTVAQDFLVSVFFMDLLFMAPDLEAKRIFFSLSFSRSCQNISMNSGCRLLRGFKISTVAYCVYCHSLMQPIALMYHIMFPYKSAMQATAAIQNWFCSLLRLLKNLCCSLQRLLMIPAVAYSGNSMATARIQMSNFERLLTRLKGQ